MSENIKETKEGLKISNQKNFEINLNNKDKNDTFYIFIKAFYFIDKFFLIFYSYIVFYLKIIFYKKILYLKKFIFMPFFFIFLFSLVLNENINISTDLLISAYFNDSQVIHISYDEITKGKFEEQIINQNSKDNKNKENNCQTCREEKYSYNEINYNKKNIENKTKKNNNSKNQEKEFNIFNYIPIKTIFITCFSFFALYIIIKTTYYSRINNSIFINMIGVYTSFKILSYLYFTKYFLASGLIFVLFFYFYKCSIDSIYLKLKFRRSDFEIFSIHLSASNSRQFILKFIILFTSTLLSGLLSIFYFQLYFNYMAFYTCLFTFIIFICNCAENKLLEEYKYSKNIFIFIFGFVNFIINKILKNKYYINKDFNEGNKNNLDKYNFYHIIDYLMIPKNFSNINSFYIISDIFTLLCFDYLDDYIEFKYKNFLDKKKKNKKFYSKQDIIFHCLFILSIGLNISSIFIKEYMCLLLSLNISQKFNNYFSTIFNHNLSRILNHLILIIYIVTQYEISTIGDEYLISLMLVTRLNKNIIQIILKLFGISILIYALLYSNYIYYYANNSHQIFYHYYSGFDFIKNENNEISEDNNNDSSNSEDNDNLIDDESDINDNLKDNLFKIASKLHNKKYKIKIIHSSNDENNKIIFYLTSEIVLCYIDTCIVIILVNNYEKDLLIKFIYGVIIIFLKSRKYFILNETKNDGQYYFYYLISFFFSIRLIILTNNNLNIISYLSHINVYILLLYYCFMNKRNYFLSIILLIHLTVAYSNLKSNFILFDIISVLLFLFIKNLKSQNKYKIEKYEEQSSNLSLIFLLSLLAFFLIQLYGINKFYTLSLDLLKKVLNLFNEMNLMTYGENKENKKVEPIEFYIITDLIDWIENKIIINKK